MTIKWQDQEKYAGRENLNEHERYSRKLNLIFKGFPKDSSYSNHALREEKAHLIALLQKGLQLSAVQVSAILDSIVNIHWMDAHRQNRNEGNSFIVRFDRQESVELINKNLPKLKDYRVRLPNGQENYVRIDPDLTKQQRDEQGELIRARAILKLQKKDVSNVRMHSSKGFYVIMDGEKYFGDSDVIQEALKNNKEQTKIRKPRGEKMDTTNC
ncbi:hypothetical protein AAVH_24355 [Aphelenchoides avenae]|nr:hypothetical protein AAVH_24355 [Aphelenchus avenae]